MENIIWLFKYNEVNSYYQLYGQDRKKCKKEYDSYIDYYSFREQRNYLNKIGRLSSQTILLRDKFLFYKYLKSFGIPTPKVFALYSKGMLLDVNLKEFKEETTFDVNREEYFVKDKDGECASFVKKIESGYDINEVINDLPHGSDLIFQEKIIQCEEMNLLNPESINTIRIVTENLSGSPQVFSSVLRVGNKNTGNVDNWATGGIAIGIKADGTLKQYGFMKPINGLKVDCHPDTGVVFSEFKVPYYVEACELACKAHKAFYNVATIGWDIAISNVGPIIIEGNDNWEISLMQACNEGYKQKWSNLIKNFM